MTSDLLREWPDAGERLDTPGTAGTRIWRGDRGRAFRRIMSCFETTQEFEDRIKAPLRGRAFPAQVVWGLDDAERTAEHHGESVRRALGLEADVQLVEGKHFVQENSPVDIAERVALLIQDGEDR